MLRDKWVTLRDSQKTCWACNDWFTYSEHVRHQVIAGGGEFMSIYTCWKCNDGKQSTDWARIFAEEEEKPLETLEEAFRREAGQGDDDIPF